MWQQQQLIVQISREEQAQIDAMNRRGDVISRRMDV